MSNVPPQPPTDSASNQSETSPNTPQSSGRNVGQVAVPQGFGVPIRPRPDLTLALDGVELAAVSQARERIGYVALAFIMVFVVLGLRLLDLAVFGEPPQMVAFDDSQAMRPVRAEIVDRNGTLLATNLETVSVALRPREVLEPRRMARTLARLLDLDEKDVTEKIESGRHFVWIKRKISPEQHQALFSEGLVGLSFVPEIRRAYPNGELAAHVVGFTDVDNRGLSGVERFFDDRLVSQPDEPLRLTIDLGVQHALMRELAQSVVEFRAKGAAGIVMDVHSGEVLGLVSLPTFDPENPTQADQNARRNRAVADRYEMGSTFKAFTTAMVLDSGRVGLANIYDTTKPIRIGRFTISDTHPEPLPLTVPEIMMHSSNIGAAKMALDVEADMHRAFMQRMGLTRTSDIELAEAVGPLMPERWGMVQRMTMAFGHGIAVTPIHVATGMASIVNGGQLVPATLLPRNEDNPLITERVISEETSAVMRSLLRLVVEEGTGGKAEADGYLVMGKTGTAEKSVANGYAERSLITSFAGAFPAHDPQYAFVVLMDEPQSTRYTYGFMTAGWNAAPTAGRVVQRIAPLLGVEPVDLKSFDVQKVRALSSLVALKVEGQVE